MKLRFFIVFLLLLFVCGQGFTQEITKQKQAEFDRLAERVNACIQADDFITAISCLKRMHELKPQALDVIENLGIIYANIPEDRPELNNAFYWLLEAENRYSTKPGIYYNLACIYSIRNDLDKAVKAMNKALFFGWTNLEYMNRDNNLLNFKTTSLWKDISTKYSETGQLLNNLNQFIINENNINVLDRINYYNNLITSLKKLAPRTPALWCKPLNHLANSYKMAGNYIQAEKCHLELISIYENVLGKEHPSYANALNDLGLLYSNMEKYGQAERYLLEALGILERILGKEHFYNAITLSNLGSLYKYTGEHEKAVKHYQDAISIIEKEAGKENTYYAFTAGNLAGLYEITGYYEQAEKYYLEAHSIIEKILGKDHPDYATSLNNLGLLYYRMGDYSKTEKYYLESLYARKRIFGTNHPDYASSVNSLGGLYNAMGDYEKSEKYYLEALAVFEKTPGKNHTYYANTLNNLGSLYTDMGIYAKAEKYLLEAMKIKEQVLGKNHIEYALSLNNLGNLYNYMGDYKQAETYYLESLNIRERILGKNHLDYAVSLNNLGELYRMIGDFGKSEKYYIEAINIIERNFGKTKFEYAMLLNNLGLLYHSAGDLNHVEKYYLESLDIIERLFGKNNTNYTSSLNNLGLFYTHTGDYIKAEKYHLESLAITKQMFGKDHPGYALSLTNLGMLYINTGDYRQAEKNNLEALNIMGKRLGKKHPYYLSPLSNLSVSYLSNTQYRQSLKIKKEENQLRTDQIYRNFLFMSEQQRMAFWISNFFSFELTYSISHFYSVPESSILSYDNALFAKGLLLRTANAVRDTIYGSGNQKLIAQFEELGSIRQQINNLQQNNDNESYIRELEKKADALEKEINRSSAAFLDFNADLAINWKKVQGALKRNEAAIEFVSFKLYDKQWTDKTMYAALVLKPGMKAPQWIPLCEETELADLFAKLKDEKTNREKHPHEQADILYNENGSALYAAVWQPLEQHLKGVNTIYYSPSGLLHKVSFNAIPKENARLADIYNLNLVSSTREVAAQKKESAPASAAVYGGLLYDVDERLMRQEAIARRGTRSGTTRDLVFAEADTDEYLKTTTGSSTWNYLRFTDLESKQIYDLLAKKKIPAYLYNEHRGNKESFKALDGKKNSVIHLATHGFFNQVEKANYEEQQRQQQINGRHPVAESPLRRAGLVLAGANTYAKKPLPDTESGILIAEEVASLNLLGAQLVVLSACETALGEVNNSEGVFGLQRAFKLAGAETLIMSLWKVDDEATAILIGNFYEGWLSGKTKQEAFKEAQRKLRTDPRHAHPFYWAAFVMMD